MAIERIKIADDRHLETLGNCGGYYECPRSEGTGDRIGPLVGYAGTYEGLGGKRLQFVGDVYANFAKAEPHPNVLRFFARCLVVRLSAEVDIAKVNAFCGAPIGGYSLADALSLDNDIMVIKAEKKVTALKTATSREKSELVFARHSVENGANYVIVEDVCNNFSTTEELINLIVGYGGKVLAIVCFLNRSLTVDSKYYSLVCAEGSRLLLPVVSLVRMSINEWRQDDPAVAYDIARGNVVWKPKDEWGLLMQAMRTVG